MSSTKKNRRTSDIEFGQESFLKKDSEIFLAASPVYTLHKDTVNSPESDQYTHESERLLSGRNNHGFVSIELGDSQENFIYSSQRKILNRVMGGHKIASSNEDIVLATMGPDGKQVFRSSPSSFLKKSQTSGSASWWKLAWLRFRAVRVPPRERTVRINDAAIDGQERRKISALHPPNYIRNQKYPILFFIPLVLFGQFKTFTNFYFLLITITQFYPPCRISMLFSSIAPLALVVFITMSKEAYDDYQRYCRDKEVNSQRYTRITPDGPRIVPSSDICVGDLIIVSKDERVPADMILLRTTDRTGTVFIRTDQLDGEIDWKMRVAVGVTQSLPNDYDIFGLDAEIFAERPHKDIYAFTGVLRCLLDSSSEQAGKLDSEAELDFSAGAKKNYSNDSQEGKVHEDPLAEENTMWMNTIVANGSAIGVVIYTGRDTRASMNTASPSSKTGITDMEINRLSKILGALVLALSVTLMCLKTFRGPWWIHLVRFICLFSLIIPISLRVNLDMAKLIYCSIINGDKRIPGVIIRTGNLPEELGRVHYLLSDKTGTLTKNDMELRRLHMGTMCYGPESVAEVRDKVTHSLIMCASRDSELDSSQIDPANISSSKSNKVTSGIAGGVAARGARRDQNSRIFDTMQALALCHNVTPSIDDDEGMMCVSVMDQISKPSSSALNGGKKNEISREDCLLSQSKINSQNFISESRREENMLDENIEVTSLENDSSLLERGVIFQTQIEKEPLSNNHLENLKLPLRKRNVQYQASSPDEVAIVRWCELAGLQLVHRDRESVHLEAVLPVSPPSAQGMYSYAEHNLSLYNENILNDKGLTSQSYHTHDLSATTGSVESRVVTLQYEILHMFPFTSETKRMGVIVKDNNSGDILFLEKGADVKMAQIVCANDWLEEECANMAREGLRTLVIARKRLTLEQYLRFDEEYKRARLALVDRAMRMQSVVEKHLECGLELLAVTGVEDKLQDDVRPTLEKLRHAGIRIWMLTGDKVETATNVAISSRLFSRDVRVLSFQKLSVDDIGSTLQAIERAPESALVIDGPSLDLLMKSDSRRLMAATLPLQSVVCCRCTPTQKADVAQMIRCHGGGKRVCCIGDGGNDVSMIQAADIGIGIVGKEGRQASLAADVSINQFSHILRLLVWHGRNSYRNTAKLTMFVFHRGVIITTMQAIFMSIFYYSPIALFQGLILVGYSTVYTALPILSLVLDRDISDQTALTYVELYKDLTRGREITLKVFFKTLMISVFQGAVLMVTAMLFFDHDFIHVVSITFTSLILNELLMVANEINTWHYSMVLSEFASLVFYVSSMRVLKAEFDRKFIVTARFLGLVGVMTLLSFLPLYLFSLARRMLAPNSATKLQGH